MPELITSPGDTEANSYVTLDEYQVYLSEMYGIDSSSTDSGQQESWLIRSTRRLDLILWKGWKTDTDQALTWPRKYVINPDAPPTSVNYFEDDEVPTRVKHAQMEMAYAIQTGILRENGQRIESYQMDGLQVKKSKPTLTNGLPDAVYRLISPLRLSPEAIR